MATTKTKAPAAALTKGGAAAVTTSPGSQTVDIAPATEFAPSGAPVQSVPDVDPSHPAVDADPRAGTSVAQNAIDFNDPRRPGREVVAEQLGYGKAKDEA